jgi:hypothetical protein
MRELSVGSCSWHICMDVTFPTRALFEQDLLNDYLCSCAPGFYGLHCETELDECLPEPCINHGTCVDLVNGYSCTCAPEFTVSNGMGMRWDEVYKWTPIGLYVTWDASPPICIDHIILHKSSPGSKNTHPNTLCQLYSCTAKHFRVQMTVWISLWGGGGIQDVIAIGQSASFSSSKILRVP